MGAQERAQISLTLHVHILELPLLNVLVRNESSVAEVANSVSEIIESHVFNLNFVALGAETEFFWRSNMVELPVVACSDGLKAIANKVAIELLEETNKC